MSELNNWVRSKLVKRPGFWVFHILGWFFYSLINYLQIRVGFIDPNDFNGWIVHMVIGFLITLPLRFFYKKVLAKEMPFYKIGLTVVGSTVVVSVCWYMVTTSLIRWFWSVALTNDPMDIVLSNIHLILWTSIFLSIPVFGWSILYFGIKFWMNILVEKEKSEKSQLLAQQAQLQMLRYQLNPHFLFNSLSSIQALIYDDPKHADVMLTELSDFLRFSIRDKDKIYIPLREEVVIAGKYLSMEKRRFPDRLNYTINITDEAAEIEVVAFILQPFVENAVKYGMRTSPENLIIEIKGYVTDEKLVLEIRNSGEWVEPRAENSGTGIGNVLERLKNAYPGKSKVGIDKGKKFVSVTIEIPVK